MYSYLKIFFLTLGIFSLQQTAAQELFLHGARNSSLGKSVTADDHPEMLYENLAGIASTEQPLLLSAFQNRFGVRALSSLALGIIYPIKSGTTSLILQQFGDRYYHEQQIGLGYSHQIRYIRLGTRINYLRRQAAGQDSGNSFVAELGGTVTLSPKIAFGAYLYNLHQARDPNAENRFLSTMLKTGFSYKPISKLSLYTALSKQLDRKEQFHFGLEYLVHKSISARLGLSTQPFTSAFGFGINYRRLELNYNFSYLERPGNSHLISIIFNLKKRKLASSSTP
jgi:hypothetical protein